MHDFKYKGKELYCEGVRLSELAEKYGTPLFVYSYKTLIGHYKKLRDAFRSVNPLICFSLKSNSNLAIARALVDAGAGVDIVSGGEMFRALKIGCSPEKIVYASVGKTEEEIKEAIRKGILLFNVESIPELKLISNMAVKAGRSVDISLRLNPDVKPRTHKYITTANKINKFGIDKETVKWIANNSHEFPNINIAGLHLHIGSQIVDSKPFIEAIKKTIGLIHYLRIAGVGLKWLNIGGGLGIIYNNEEPQTAAEYARAVLPLINKTGLNIILEPGRFIVGNAGALLTRVIYVKDTARKRFVIVDAGMNDLIRPALYEAYHDILPVVKNRMSAAGLKTADVVGPICESSDFLGKDRRLPELLPGDLLSVMSAGAYGFSMSSNYNSRCRCAEVMVAGKKTYLVREREAYSDLIRGEHVPEFLFASGL